MTSARGACATVYVWRETCCPIPACDQWHRMSVRVRVARHLSRRIPARPRSRRSQTNISTLGYQQRIEGRGGPAKFLDRGQKGSADRRVVMKAFYLSSVLACVVALGACSGSSSSPMMPTVPTPAPTPSGPPVFSVAIRVGASFLTLTAYVPNPITVSVGTTVKWTNSDSVAHTVSSQNNLWDSGDMEPGATFTRTFQTAGSFPYYCVYHPLMVGTVNVQ